MIKVLSGLKFLSQNKSIIYLSIFIMIHLFTALFILFISPSHFIYDESIFVNNITLLDKEGISSELLINLKDQAPGPLYQIVHKLFSPLTNLDPIRMRIMNYILYIISLILLSLSFIRKERRLITLIIISAIPSLFVIAGIALTEIPAIIMLVISLCSFKYLIEKDFAILLKYPFLILAGITLGLSIAGRTQFLLLIPSFILFFRHFDRTALLVYLISSSVIPGTLFFHWQGLVPPSVSALNTGYNVTYFFLAVSYLMIFILFIVPDLFKVSFNIGPLLLFSLILSLFNYYFNLIEFAPFKGVLSHLLQNTVYVNIYSFIAPALLLSFLIISLKSLIKQVAFDSYDKWQSVFVIAIVLICFSCVKSAYQFSSRYIIQSFPFFYVVFSPYMFLSKRQIVVSIIGLTIGFASLYSYYQL